MFSYLHQKYIGFLLLTTISILNKVEGQGTWTQKADFGGTIRSLPAAFSIGTKGYFGSGHATSGATKDFWEYDPITNVWTQKADIGGPLRSEAVGFSIGTKGYIGTGDQNTSLNFLRDFWEWDQSTNIWTQKADFGGVARWNAVGFSIGSKGYIGTGATTGAPLNDFWEYDPSTDTWTQKANFGGSARMNAVGFSVNNFGYIGTGGPFSNTHTDDFWQYNPATNTWTQKATVPGGARNYASGFSLNGKGYLGLGGQTPTATYNNDFWEYDPMTDSWSQITNFGGVPRWLASGFSIGNKGYVGTGYVAAFPNYLRDFWEYNPCGSGVTPVVNISQSPTGSVCSGTSITFTATPTNGGSSPSYQWQVNGINVGTNSPIYTTSTLSNGDIVTVIMTSSAACANPITVTSNSITVSIVQPGVASVNISASSTTICAGSSVTFTATPTNGGGTPSYQWQVNGINVGGNLPIYISSTLINNDIVRVVMTSNLGCVTGSPATSNSIIMTVVQPGVASVNISASSTTICSGTNIIFTASPTNGGSSPSYQWKVNGVNVGSNSPTYSTTTLANGDVVSVVMTSSLICAIGSPATSNTLVISVTQSVVPSVTIMASSTSICSGDAVTFDAIPINGGTSPNFQWQVNGISVGANSPQYITSGLTNGDLVTLLLTSNANCAAPTNVASNSILISVFPRVTPAVSISTSTVTICLGSTTTFLATATNGGSSPSYQWQVNGLNVGTGSPTYVSNSFLNGDVVTVLMTSNAQCVTSSSAVSTPITLTVINPSAPPTISIAPSTNNICTGDTIIFYATSTNGGTSPIYQWKFNGLNVGINNPSYFNNNLQDGDIINCQITSNASCVVPNTAISMDYRVIINPDLCPVWFYVPNAFTPNKDGLNDTFKPVLRGVVTSYAFCVYNRWGQKVYQSETPNIGWDGKVFGLETDSNVFVWTCGFKLVGKPAEYRKGVVFLIR